MLRRIFIPQLQPGRVSLDPRAAHYLCDVLRLTDGTEVEAFNSAGLRAIAVLRRDGERGAAFLEVGEISPSRSTILLTVASAVPKGDRADYLVEKLAELGVARWVPLDTVRSVVVPKGDSKRTRWERIAQEAARQSNAAAVLQIGPVTPLGQLADEAATGAESVRWFCSTTEGHAPALLTQPPPREGPKWVVIGPEGGFTVEEEALLSARGFVAVSLGTTILRIETAAVVAAALALAVR